MEDKWFIFMENGILYFHRSWTGVCIYQVHFDEQRRIVENFAENHEFWSDDMLVINRSPWSELKAFNYELEEE